MQDHFLHVRILIGMITGLAIARLLNGLARFVQHPSRAQVDPVHFGWSLFLLLAVMHFWWFEFGLGHITHWDAPAYFFVTGYAMLHFLAATLLYPDRMEEYVGYGAYFQARQRWFYGLLAAIFLADLIDSNLKGAAHVQSLGPFYLWRQIGLALLVTVAALWRNRRFNLVVVAVVLMLEIIWIFAEFDVTGWSFPD